LKFAFVSVSGPALKPSTATLLPQFLPLKSGMADAVTAVTPGSVASSSSIRSNSAADRAGG